MGQDQNIHIKKNDHMNITALLDFTTPEVRDLLQNELDRAIIVPDDELPADVVAINSIVTFIDIKSQKKSTVTLTYPNDANPDEAKISVLAPIGAALIGLRIGQTIEWPVPQEKDRTIQVVEVTNN